MTDGSKPRTIPLSERSSPPKWVTKALSVRQAEKLKARTVWFLMLDLVDLTPAERLVLYRLWFFTSGKDDYDGATFDAWPSIATLARKLSLSESAVRNALHRCASIGLVRIEERVGCYGERQSNAYTLSWPASVPAERRDRMARLESWCLAKTKKGKLCHQPAGWRTDHAGEGPCRLHDPLYNVERPPPRSGVGAPLGSSETPPHDVAPSESLSELPLESSTESRRRLHIIEGEAS